MRMESSGLGVNRLGQHLSISGGEEKLRLKALTLPRDRKYDGGNEVLGIPRHSGETRQPTRGDGDIRGRHRGEGGLGPRLGKRHKSIRLSRVRGQRDTLPTADIRETRPRKRVAKRRTLWDRGSEGVVRKDSVIQ